MFFKMNAFYIFLFISSAYSSEISSAFKQRNKAFAVDLLLHVDTDPTKNVVCSSFSLETVLGLTSLGAKGETASELKKVVRLPSSDVELRTSFKNVQSIIKEAVKVSISSANQVYLAEGFDVEPDFLKIATEDFNSGVQNVNFSASQKAADEINSWVEKQTRHKIKNLIREDQVGSLTRMVLVNALYFRGIWQHPFDIDDTEKNDFHLSKDQNIQVDTMKVTAFLEVARNEEFKVTFLRIPYYSQNKALLLIAIPDEIQGVGELLKNFKNFINDEQNFTREYMTVYLPKFRVESTLDLKAILEKMGVHHLFSKPDLSGITKEDVEVDAINQKVFVDVNEVGTEAAAATAEIANSRILMVGKSTPAVYRVNRPFLFAINYDGISLLSGKIMNPSQ